jgi:hypothetical protein
MNIELDLSIEVVLVGADVIYGTEVNCTITIMAELASHIR